MRESGRAGSDRIRDLHGHLCSLHERTAAYHRDLVEFFAQGLRAGLRVSYAGPDGVEASRAHLRGLGDLDRLLAEGTLRIRSMRDVYGADGPVDPERVVADLAAETEAALADGFRGLAVSADATELLRTPEQRDALARYEFLVDQYIAGHPVAALCGYHLELGDDTVAEFAALHSAGASGEAALRLFGCDDGALGLRGQLDPADVAALGRMLTRLRPGVDTGTFVVDLAGVEYVDHRLLLALAEHARATGASLSLRAAPPFAARLIELLPVARLQGAEVRT